MLNKLPFPGLLLLAGALAAPAADMRPNIPYCLADDWSWPHAGVYGDQVIRAPTFDRVAREGMRFNYCFSAASSCTPSRAAMLTGQYPHRLEEGSCLWGFLPKKFPVYPDLLEKAGYVVGCTRKGWGPGDFRAGGFTRNPAGPIFKGLAAFLKTVPDGKPFGFRFGSATAGAAQFGFISWKSFSQAAVRASPMLVDLLNSAGICPQ